MVADASEGVARIRQDIAAPPIDLGGHALDDRWPSDVAALTDAEANRVLADIEYTTGRHELCSAPHQLHVAVSERCNMSCIMCRVSADPDEFKSHLSDDARAQIDRLLPMINTVYFAGDAEPFHHFAASPVKHFVDVTESVGGPAFVATTNGLLMNDEVCDTLLDRFSQIRISVDSPYPDVYRSIRVRSSFDRVQRNIEHLRDLKVAHGRGRGDSPTIHINYLIMDRTFRGIIDFIELANEWHVSEVRFSPLRVNFDATLAGEDIFSDISKVIELTDLMTEVHRRANSYGVDIIDRTARPVKRALAAYGLIPESPSRPDHRQRRQRMPVCPAPWGDLWISRTGGVSFCLEGASIGNVNESSLRDVYNSEVAQRIRHQFIDGDYSSCKREQCPRGIRNVGTNRGEPPVGFETTRVDILQRDVYANTGWSR